MKILVCSRAKQRCQVFSSITADDIDLTRASGRGVAALKSFLSYAQTGRLGIALVSGNEEQSPFEEAVRRAVESLGHDAQPQVGVAGFFIDLAIVDPQCKGAYLLGIECDGATYHSSRSARDRDRLRQAVLEDHGWIIHRIWSTDWLQRPTEQLRRLSQAIEDAKSRRRSGQTEVADDTPEQVVEREVETGSDAVELTHFSTPYREASISINSTRQPHEVSPKEMSDVLFRIVEIEGPIHEEELVARVRDLWALDRAGSRIQEAVATGVRALLTAARCCRAEGFVSIPSMPVVVRNRGDVRSASLRKPEMLPPSEVRAAILVLIDEHYGASEEELPTATARMFGFKATSTQLRVVIQKQADKLLRQGILEKTNGVLRRAQSGATTG